MRTLSELERSGLHFLGIYTAGRYDINALAGPAKASCRAHVMSALYGKRVPQSKAGINAMWSAFFVIAGVDGNCIRHREDAFIEWAKLRERDTMHVYRAVEHFSATGETE
jgi:hypothetical protein